MTTAGTKKIFISDVHLGDARSFAGPHPYGWFRSNIANLANFLTEQLRAPEVAEVVILGDLFDEWLIPTDVEPLNSFQAICNNPHNSPVIKALRQLATRGILTYVPGNHDMTLSTEVLPENQKFMEAAFPGVRYCFDQVEPSCPNLPKGVYRSGKLVAEHGNRYALCNASDTWTKKLRSFLPFGYFLSRMVAYKASKKETKEDFLGILKKFIMKFKRSRTLVKDLYMAFAKDAGLTEDDPINMHGIPGFPGTVGAIGSLYEHLIEDWKKKRPDIDWTTALFSSETGDLLPAASHIYLSPSGSDQNIVIFGHTHKADLREPTILEASPAGQNAQDLPSRWIYANCGSWVDSAPHCTYVATQEDAAAGRQYVRVFAYPSNTLLQEGFVKL